MSTRMAVLGLLSTKPMHGYEIKQNFEEIVSNIWSINFGQLYPLLKKMEQEGIISKEKVTQENRPDRLVYQITPVGRVELQEWLATPVVKRQVKDEFYLKMLFLDQAGKDTAMKFIDTQIATLEKQIKGMKAWKKQMGDFLETQAGLLFEAGFLHMQADVKWLKICRENFKRHGGKPPRCC